MGAYILVFGALLYILYATFYSYKLPKHIPKIPFWTTLYGTLYGTSRVDFYDKYMRTPSEKYGAVVLWHFGSWTIHLSKPEYLTQMFSEDAVFAKGGSYIKAPWGVLGQLFGENIIDTSGEVWKQHRALLQPAIKRQFDYTYMKQMSAELKANLWRKHEMQDVDCTAGIDIDEHAQLWAFAISCKYFMDIDIESMPDLKNRLTHILTDLKFGLMRGITMVFPFLQRFPWLFPSNRRALRIIREFEQVVSEMAYVNTDKESEMDPKAARRLLNAARETGTLSEFHYRSNMKQLLLAGFEEVESALLSILVALAKHPEVQSALHAEMSSVPATYDMQDLDKLPLLLSVILETLRLHPPFPSLTNRYTTREVLLGSDMNIPAGTWVGWNPYLVQTNVRIWGPDARVFRPSRWGQDVSSINAAFRTHQAKATFIPFSSRSRTCLGVSFALMQLKIVLYELFSQTEWGMNTEAAPKLRKGPLVNPSHCKFILRARKGQTALSE